MKVKFSSVFALLFAFSHLSKADYDLSLSSPVWTMLSVKRGNYVEMDYYFLALLKAKKREDAVRPIVVEENHGGRMIASVGLSCDPSGKSKIMPTCSESVEQQWAEFNAQSKIDECDGFNQASCADDAIKMAKIAFRQSTEIIQINEFGDIATSHMPPGQRLPSITGEIEAARNAKDPAWTDIRCGTNTGPGQICAPEDADQSSNTSANESNNTNSVSDRKTGGSRGRSNSSRSGSDENGRSDSVTEEERQLAYKLNKDIQILQAELASCDASSDKASIFCGGDRTPANTNLMRQVLGADNKNLFEQLAYQVAQINSAGKDMLKQCQTMKGLATTVATIEGAYSAACIGYQASCRKSCSGIQEKINEKSSQVSGSRYASLREQGLGEVMSVDPISALATLQSKAANNLSSCQAPAQAGASAGISKTMQSAQMLMQASKCVSALEANQSCLTAQDMSKPECRNFCSIAQNSNNSLCISKASLNCADPAQASTQPACRCINSPSDPSCKYAGGGSANYPFPGGSGGRSGNSESSSGLPGGGAAGTFGSGGGGDDGMQSSSSRGGASAAGGLAQFQGGAGGGASGSGSGGQGLQSPRGGGAGASGYNADIMNGFHEGGGKRGRAQHSGSGANQGNGYGGRNTASASKSKINLRDFLPNGSQYKADPRKLSFAGSAVLTRDGVTGPHGPSLFEKVSRRYKMKGSLLLQ